jgi:uncharacterized protein YndB with AHSA1/START domain
MEQSAVERSIWIDAPRARVWNAITEPGEIAQWFMPPALGAQMRRGDSGKLVVLLGPMEVDLALMEGIEPQQRVTTRSLPDKTIATTYTLAEENGGTRVTVTMTGFDTLPEDARQERITPSGKAWEMALDNLKAYVDGAEIPHPQGFAAALLGFRREGDRQGRRIFAIERSIWIRAPRERVWRAVTDPAEIAQWFSPGTQWRGTGLHVGGTISIIDAETGADTNMQVIDLVDPPVQLVTRTVGESTAPTYITDWSLAEEDGGTRLTITHSGYETVAEAGPGDDMEQNAFGFGMMLANLKAQVEGEPLPFPWGF